jgi:hypothetical protein
MLDSLAYWRGKAGEAGEAEGAGEEKPIPYSLFPIALFRNEQLAISNKPFKYYLQIRN